MKPSSSLATLVAVSLALAGRPAWGHTYAPLRTVVIQVESCEVVMMVGYRAGSREQADTLVARVASQPKSHARDAMRDVLAGHAMRPLTLSVDGRPLLPATVRAKLATDEPSGRPMVVLLVTYPLPAGSVLQLASHDPRSTRISWSDLESGRVDLDAAPAQGKFFAGVASFLLNLTSRNRLATPGGSACATSKPKH